MNFSIKTAPLRSALAAVAKVIQKSPSDILMAAHVSCADQDVIVSACSPHADLRIMTGETSPKPFAFAVNAERLKQLVDRATSEDLKFSVPADGSAISVAGGTVRGKIKQLPADTFPGITAPQGDPLFSVPELNVARIIPSLTWAAAPALFNKAIFQGVSFVAAKGQVRLSCMSGQGACTHTEENPDSKAEAYACISLISANVVAGVFDEALVAAYSNRLVFENETTRVGVPLLASGQGVPMKMPAVAGRQIKIARPAMVEALRACASIGATAGKIVIVRATEAGGDEPRVTFFAQGADGEIAQEVPIEGLAGLDCYFNGPQMTRALAACHGDDLTITVPQGANAATSPHKINSGAWEALVMPVKV